MWTITIGEGVIGTLHGGVGCRFGVGAVVLGFSALGL